MLTLNDTPIQMVKENLLTKYPKQGTGKILSFNNRLHNIVEDFEKVKDKRLSEAFNLPVFAEAVHRVTDVPYNVCRFSDYIKMVMPFFDMQSLDNYVGYIPNSIVEKIEGFKTKNSYKGFYTKNNPHIIAPKSLFINGEDVRVNDPILLYPLHSSNSGDLDYWAMVAQWE